MHWFVQLGRLLRRSLSLAPFACVSLWGHPDRVEDQLLLHYAAGAHPPSQGIWEDLTHRLKGQIQGAPVLANLGPAQALLLNGLNDWVLVAGNLESARPALPTREISVTAWVMLDETQPNGGVIGFVQDNGDFEKGWVLGYGRQGFSFRLATTGADDGDGTLTRVTGRTPIETGRWHHVVATYDGTVMRLYVDGKPDGESMAQSGDILYPDSGRYTLGAYADADELHPMAGALFEAKVYQRVLAAAEIAGVAERNRAWLDWRPPINREVYFVVQPFLQSAAATGITIVAECNRATRMTVEYGEMQPLTEKRTTPRPGMITEVALTGLKPATRYFYRVTSLDEQGDAARSEIFSFQTIPRPQDAWAFGIIGDTQRNPEVTRHCADGMFALRPNMILHCGDVVDDGFAKQQWVLDLFAPCARLFSHVPVFPVIGNHEKNAHWYYDYFSLPAPEYYYTFTMGNAQFFMIDSNKDCGPGSEQYVWLEKALAASTATWKFTAHHHPCFSSDEDDYGDQWKGRPGQPYTWGDSNVRRLVPLYEKSGVDIAFAGHIHSYERTWPLLNMAIHQQKGVRYIVSGGGGGTLEQAGPQRAWFTLHVARGHHYAFATLHEGTLQFKAYDLAGRLFDVFELSKSKGP